MKFSKIVLLFILLYMSKINAQLPLGDATFSISIQEPFNSFNSAYWCPNYCWGDYNNGYEINNAANLNYTFSPGYLAIKCETITPLTYTLSNYSPLKYQSGAIRSIFSHKYGYFEMTAKMPVGKGYWPAFWLFEANLCQWWNEIDIVENAGYQNQLDNEMAYNYIWTINSTTCTSCTTCVNGFYNQPPITVSNTSNDHKYGMFWEPGRMTYYFDDNPVKVVEDPVYTPTHSLTTIINFAIYPIPPDVPGPSTTFPAYFLIKDLNIWQLKPDCNTQEVFCSTAFNVGTYNYAVKKSISIGGSGCSSPSTINTSSDIRLWATDYVLLDEGTTINDNGSGAFTINFTACPE